MKISDLVLTAVILIAASGVIWKVVQDMRSATQIQDSDERCSHNRSK